MNSDADEPANMMVLNHLLDKLQQFEFVHCEMAHEKIRREPCGQKPILNPLADHGYARESYCNNDIRKIRLGCAHTSARLAFSEILDALPASVADPMQVEQWKSRLNELDQKIVLVDWQKSDEELAHAQHTSKLFSNHSNEVKEAQENIARTDETIEQLIQTHGGYVDRLETLRDEVVDCIQSKMKPAP